MVCASSGLQLPNFLKASLFLDGQLAAEQNSPFTDNPHELGSDESAWWHDGWWATRRKALEATSG